MPSGQSQIKLYKEEEIMSSRSLNSVQLIGNLTRDPELRYTPQGTAVCTFGLATNRGWTDQVGQKQEATEFHRIVCWQKLAELCSQLLFKGRKVFVSGRLQTRKWTGSDNQERQTTEIVIDNMIILDSKQKDDSAGSTTSDDNQEAVVGSTTGFASDDKITEDDDNSKTDNAKVKKTVKADKPKDKTKAKPVSQAKESEEVKADDIPF